MTLLSASFSATMRVHLEDRPGAFADLARAIADAGGSLDAIDLVRVEQGRKVSHSPQRSPRPVTAAR